MSVSAACYFGWLDTCSRERGTEGPVSTMLLLRYRLEALPRGCWNSAEVGAFRWSIVGQDKSKG